MEKIVSGERYCIIPKMPSEWRMSLTLPFGSGTRPPPASAAVRAASPMPASASASGTTKRRTLSKITEIPSGDLSSCLPCLLFGHLFNSRTGPS